MNYSLITIRNACEALMRHDEYSNITCIAVLNWSDMPEVSKEIRSFILGDTRITEYLVGNTRVVDVYPYGKFQIL
jgi:hypothetical protein